MNMRPQHITITSIKYLISYPINMKVSNQVFTTSNSNKCVGGLYLCMYVRARYHKSTNTLNTNRVHSPTYSTKSQPSGRKYTVLYG